MLGISLYCVRIFRPETGESSVNKENIPYKIHGARVMDGSRFCYFWNGLSAVKEYFGWEFGRKRNFYDATKQEQL